MARGRMSSDAGGRLILIVVCGALCITDAVYIALPTLIYLLFITIVLGK